MLFRKRRERDLQRELESHLELEAEEHGGDLQAARRAFGNRSLIEEQTRASWGWAGVLQLLRDLRLAARTLSQRPAFTAVAILSLAIGIGATTAIFSVANGILIRTLPVEGARRLVILRQHDESLRREICCLRQDVVRRLQLENVGFEDLLGISDEMVTVRDRQQSERLRVEFVTTNYFSMLGLKPAAGRFFQPADNSPGAVAVISHKLWMERFGARPDAIGRRIDIDGTPFEIIGVTQPGYAGLSLTVPREIQIPSSMMRPMSQGDRLEVVARLRPDVSEEPVRQRLNLVGKSIQRASGMRVNEKDDFRFLDGSQGIGSGKEEFGQPVWILGLLVTVLLLLACANLTGLLLVRSVERSHEAGMRVALGASRAALFRQFFSESLLVSGIGGAAAWLIALLLLRILSGYLAATNSDLAAQVRPDTIVFAFSAFVTLAAAFLVGTWPAWKASKADPLPAVRGASSGSRGRPLISRGIISAQVALAVALLFCAGLFTRTLSNLRSIDLGFPPENLIFVQPRFDSASQERSATVPFFEELLRRVEQLPTVRAASFGVIHPLSGSTLGSTVNIPGHGWTGDSPPKALMYYVSSGYFRTMGIPLLEGEDLPRQIGATSQTPVIVNEEFVRRYLGGERLGRVFGAMGSQVRVIGVVGDSKYSRLREETQPIFYLPIAGPVAPVILQVRTDSDPEKAMAQMRALVHAIDPRVTINLMLTMEAQLDETLRRERMLAFLSTISGVVAVGLSAIGLYGVLAFSVARRTREIGIRTALGASRFSIIGMVVREGGWLVAGGVLLGVPLALAFGRAAESLLYGLRPQNVGAMAGAVGFLVLFASAAMILPAWRAARLNAVRTLRHD